jgi:hypothetical protein
MGMGRLIVRIHFDEELPARFVWLVGREWMANMRINCR